MAAWVAVAEKMQEGVVVGQAAETSGAELALAAQALLLGLLLGSNLTNLVLDLILEVVDFSFKSCDGCHYPLNMVGRQWARWRDGGSTIKRWERAR